jgi:hypothetical protein
MTGRQIGTVEILRLRIYNIDPDDEYSDEVAVEPGECPVLVEDGVYFWRMRGRLSRRVGADVAALGDGMFMVSPGVDVQVGDEIEFSSRRFSADEFQALLSDDVCREGDTSQRLRFNIKEGYLR